MRGGSIWVNSENGCRNCGEIKVWQLSGDNEFPLLLRCDATPAFVLPDKMAAVIETGLLCDIIDIQTWIDQQILRFIKPDILDIFLAGSSVIFTEKLCEMRIAHMTEPGKLLYLQWFRGMGIYIFQNMIKRHSMFSARTCLSFFCACFAGYRNQKTIDEIKSDYVKIYEYLFPKLLK